jgi:FkbM family methyltransferase
MARKDWIKSFLVRLTSSTRAQALLERGVVFAHQLMGIGSGSSPSWSGENTLRRRLELQQAASGKPICVFDVGANTGQFISSVLIPLQDAGLPLEIHAFEPSPVAFRTLQDTFGGMSNAHLNNFGLSHENGEVQLFSDRPGSGLASLSRRRLDHFGIDYEASERVRMRLLDDYCRERQVQRIDLLKLDVEGHELNVLRGAQRLFQEQRIGMVSFEFGGCNIDSRTFVQDFWYFFRDHGGGRLHRLSPSGTLVPLPEYREDLEQFRNTIFVVLQADA